MEQQRRRRLLEAAVALALVMVAPDSVEEGNSFSMHRVIIHISDLALLDHYCLNNFHRAISKLTDGSFLVSVAVEEPALFRYSMEVHADMKNTVKILPTIRSGKDVSVDTYQAVLTHSAKTKAHLAHGKQDTNSVLLALYECHDETFFSPHYLI